ncbi:MAG: lipopolysaccharide biosynthesis protein [Acidimicrobiales bacterium]
MSRTTSRLSARASNALPDGTATVGIGLAVNGLATYGFLVISRRALGEDTYSALAALWAIVFILGPGFFQPLEQEVSRVSADRASRGEGSEPVLRRAAIVGGGIFGLLTLGLLAASPWLVEESFDGEWTLLGALILTLAAFGAGELLRGLLAGYHRFNAYGTYFATEGLSRVVLALVLAIAGVTLVGPFGLVVAAGPLAALIIAGRGQRDLIRPGPDAGWGEVTQALGFLLAASVSEAFLLNIGVVTVKVLADSGQEEEAGRFLNGLLMARVPLFLFQAVKASLIPNLARMAGLRQWDEFLGTLYRLLAAVLGISVAGVIGSALLGPWVVETVFGDSIGRLDMALLAASMCGLMLAVSLALTLVSLGKQRQVAFGWLPGVFTFPIVVSVASEDLFLRVELALVAAVAVAVTSMGVITWHELKRVR